MPPTLPDLVSTIIPVHNRPRLLDEAVESVLVQSWRPIEVIIVDDGSTDETPAVADRWALREPDIFRVLHVANGGPGAAREAGRQMVRGEFIQYLDSDDLLMPEKFALQVAALRTDPTADVAYGRARFRHADGRIDDPLKWTDRAFASMFPSFLQSRWWTTSCPLYRRCVVDKTGPWLASWNEEDWEYDCRIASSGGRLARVPELVCEQRDHGTDRLSREGLNPSRLRDRALAQTRIAAYAEHAGIALDAPEMQHFARALFLLARHCGAAGLAEESRNLFDLAKSMSLPERARALDFRLYERIANLVGWTTVGKLATQLDRLRA